MLSEDHKKNSFGRGVFLNTIINLYYIEEGRNQLTRLNCLRKQKGHYKCNNVSDIIVIFF